MNSLNLPPGAAWFKMQERTFKHAEIIRMWFINNRGVMYEETC